MSGKGSSGGAEESWASTAGSRAPLDVRVIPWYREWLRLSLIHGVSQKQVSGKMWEMESALSFLKGSAGVSY